MVEKNDKRQKKHERNGKIRKRI